MLSLKRKITPISETKLYLRRVRVFFSVMAGLVSFGFMSISGIISDNIIRIIAVMISLVIAFVVYSLLRIQYQHRQSLSNADRLETVLKNLPGMAYRCFNRRNWPMEFVSEGCFSLCGYERCDLEEQRVMVK